MLYKTRTYIVADFDNDRDAVEQLEKWNDSKRWNLTFSSAHDLQTSRDSSLYCSIKSSLRYRMSGSKTFLLIVGEHTNSITKGGCQYCHNYNSINKICEHGYSVDYKSYIEFECCMAMEDKLNIIVLYNDIYVDKDKCPDILRNTGIHTNMLDFRDNHYYWDYRSVYDAFKYYQ